VITPEPACFETATQQFRNANSENFCAYLPIGCEDSPRVWAAFTER
jgi:hypothetical protein